LYTTVYLEFFVLLCSSTEQLRKGRRSVISRALRGGTDPYEGERGEGEGDVNRGINGYFDCMALTFIDIG